MHEIRPKVFADIDGAEFRCVGTVPEIREELRDDEDDEVMGIAAEFSNLRDGWLGDLEKCKDHLRRTSIDSYDALIAALEHPMTAEEALADDEAIGA